MNPMNKQAEKIETLPIDFEMTNPELSKLLDEWCVSTFGSTDCSRYYNIMDGKNSEGEIVKGRFLAGVKADEALCREKALIERVLELLLHVRDKTRKLKGIGLTEHLKYKDIQDIEREREEYYKDLKELISSQPKLPRFPKLSKERISKAFKFLVEKKLIDNNTQERHFLYWFSCNNEKPTDLKKIEWIGNKQLAREFLTGLYKGEIKVSQIEELTPLCFFKNGTPMNLAKNKVVPSTISDDIKKFLATIV